MTTKIGALSVDLEAESAAFQQDLQKARQAVANATARMDRDLSKVSEGLTRTDGAMARLASGATAAGTAIAGFAAGFSVLAAGQYVRSLLDAAGGLGELAEQAGVGTDALQILQFAGAAAGVSAEQLQGALQQLTRRIGEAGTGSGEMAKAFYELGISARNTDGSLRSTEDVLGDIADRIAAAEDPAERARIAVELFGRSGQTLLPILSQGRAGLQEFEASARAAGVVLSGTLIGQADAAGDSIGALILRVTALQQRLAALSAPTITAAVARLDEALTALGRLGDNASFNNLLRLLGQLAGAQIAAVGGLVGRGDIGRAIIDANAFQTQIEEAEAALARLERRLQQVQQLDARALADPAVAQRVAASVAAINAQIEAQRARVAELRQAQPEAEVFGPPAPGTTARPTPPRTDTPPRTGAERQPQLAAYIAQLQQQAEAQILETSLVQAGATARAEALAVLEAEARARADAAAGLRESAALTDGERAAVVAAAGARAQSAEAQRLETERRDEGRRVTEAARTEQERYNAEVARLRELLEANIITQETFGRTLRNIAPGARNAAQEMARFGDIASSAFEDAALEGRDLSEVVNGLIRDIARLVLRQAVTQPLATAAGGFLKTLGAGIGVALGGGAIAATPALGVGLGDISVSALPDLPKRALGGPVDAGMIYEVGERGRELFVPGSDGRIIPNHAIEEGGPGRGGIVVQQSVAINAQGAGPREIDILRAQIPGMIRSGAPAAVEDAARRGGGFRGAVRGR